MTRREHYEEPTTYVYDDGGRVLSQTQNVISGSVSSVLSVDLSTYDRYGTQTFSALDVNHNGVIDPEPVEGAPEGSTVVRRSPFDKLRVSGWGRSLPTGSSGHGPWRPPRLTSRSNS